MSETQAAQGDDEGLGSGRKHGGRAVDRPTLTPAQYGDVAEVPPELEWLANITNPKTRRAYKIDVREFSAFAGLRGPAALRTLTRANIIAWRRDLEPAAFEGRLSGTRRACHPRVSRGVMPLGHSGAKSVRARKCLNSC